MHDRKPLDARWADLIERYPALPSTLSPFCAPYDTFDRLKGTQMEGNRFFVFLSIVPAGLLPLDPD